MEWLSDPQAWIGLLTLTVLEIVEMLNIRLRTVSHPVQLHQPYARKGEGAPARS
ncbi:MAG TPA: hypothetical protein VMR21_12735 [Vicinamibacteria bacterium]|nr:hypothetical protein [Vicinamibacteria bacterium]